jgi:5-methylcytosine-specific restriction endonuclease McrA
MLVMPANSTGWFWHWQHTQAEAKRRAIKRNSAVESDLALVKEFYRVARSDLLIPCEYCGLETNSQNRHVDHKVALARGGSHTSDNLAIACDKCNLSKGAKSLCEFGGAS